MRRLLLWCAALLCLVTGARSEPRHVLSTSAMLISGDTGTVCLNIEAFTERLNVSVVLDHDGKSTSMIAEDVEPDEYFQCSNFDVPVVTKAIAVAISFSATGPSTNLQARRSVVINTVAINCIYQMDKPIYRPGQTVKFRVICLNAQLKPVNQQFTLVYMQDPSRARLIQWRNPVSSHGVLNLEFNLIADASAGSYILTAERESGYPVTNWFRVEPYVLPRFFSNLACPQSVPVTADDVAFNITSNYVFGEPMAGTITVRYCKQPQYYGRRQNCVVDKGGSCANMTGELGPDGSYSNVIDLYSPFMRSTRGASFTIDVTVTEAGTGIQATESCYVSVTSQPARLNFDYNAMKQNYKRGLDYHVKAQLTDESNDPMPNQEIDIQIDNGETGKAITDSEGRVDYPVDTSKMVAANFSITISYTNPDQCYYAEWSQKDYPSSEYRVYRYYSYSGSFIDMKRPKGELSCEQSHSIDVEYIITPEGAGGNTVTFYYLVMANAVIVHSGQQHVNVSSARKGSFSFELLVSANMAPSANLIVYTILSKEVVTDTLNLNIENCFKNQVSMTFSEEKGPPGAKVDVQLSADPHSYCGMRVIDSSLLLLNSYEQFSASRILGSRGIYLYGYNVAGLDVEQPAPPCKDPDEVAFFKGNYYTPVSSTTEGDAYNNFKSVGLVVDTGLQLRKPEVCDKNPPPQYGRPGGGGGVAFETSAVAKLSSLDRSGSSAAAPVESLRTNFAETFFWIMTTVDSEGRATLSETAPDTITTWQGTAFCTSEETGFGMTKYPANFTAFQPFYAEMSLPYSIIRGETLVLKVVVPNFLVEHCVKVQVTLQNSDAYTAVQKDGVQDACVCPNGRASYTWEVQAKTIGKISFTVSAQTTHISLTCDGENDPSQPPRRDVVVQSLTVESDGIRQERTSSNLVFVQSQQQRDVHVPVNINAPPTVVPDSMSAYVTVAGDFLGIPLQNLDDLVQKPYGCGDQNLAAMASVAQVLDYLNVTRQLTKEKLEQGKSILTGAYYRQLSFSAYDGAYRMFPNSRETVNSFQTAYTFKTFETAGKYIYIDADRQQQTLIWLENAQRLENGCFRAQGRSFNQDTDSDLSLTIFIATALLESKQYSLGQTLLKDALECLKNASKYEQKISDQVPMLYAFTLAKLPEYREPLLQNLMKKAIIEGGTIHWEGEERYVRPIVPFFSPPHASAAVKLTALMLLSLAAGPSITENDLTTMAQMCIWLTREQNSRGSFRSTQDTAVGMQAMAAFAQLVYTPNDHHTVVIRRDNGEVGTIILNQENRLVAHREPLPDPTGDYVIDVSGDGWCLIQATVDYYIQVPKENSAFSLTLSTSSDSCVNGVAFGFTISGSVSYNGPRNESGVAIINMRMLSGYNVDYASINKLVDAKIIAKFQETSKGELLMYLETATQEPTEFSLKALMGQRVLNVKTSSAQVYSLSEPDENGYAVYHHPCANPKEGIKT